jgi:hypothetical protein
MQSTFQIQEYFACFCAYFGLFLDSFQVHISVEIIFDLQDFFSFCPVLYVPASHCAFFNHSLRPFTQPTAFLQPYPLPTAFLRSALLQLPSTGKKTFFYAQTGLSSANTKIMAFTPFCKTTARTIVTRPSLPFQCPLPNSLLLQSVCLVALFTHPFIGVFYLLKYKNGRSNKLFISGRSP